MYDQEELYLTGYDNQEPYINPYNPYQKKKPKGPKNPYATFSLVAGIFGILTLCSFSFTTAIILGVSAITFAIQSKKDDDFSKTAIAAIILGSITLVLAAVEYFYALWLMDLIKDPANIGMFNQMLEQFEQSFPTV